MPGIMRSRRELVDEQLAVAVDEEFHADHADVLQLLEDVTGDLGRTRRQRRRDRGRRRRHVQDVVAVTVLERLIVHRLAVESARGDDGYFRLQADKFLDDRFLVTYRGPDMFDVGGRRDLVLPLAVVAERRG